MRKEAGLLAFLILTAACGNAFAHIQTRIGAQMAWDWNMKESEQRDLEEDETSSKGIQFEILGEKLGYGLDALVVFQQDTLEQWYFDWQGQLFLRYHLFGNECFLDPFIEAGYGNAGSVLLEDAEDNQLKLSLFPSFSTGLNLLLKDRLTVGGRLTYRPANRAIPATNIEKAVIGRCQASLVFGLRMGSSSSQSRRGDYYDRYFKHY